MNAGHRMPANVLQTSLPLAACDSVTLSIQVVSDGSSRHGILGDRTVGTFNQHRHTQQPLRDGAATRHRET